MAKPGHVPLGGPSKLRKPVKPGVPPPVASSPSPAPSGGGASMAPNVTVRSTAGLGGVIFIMATGLVVVNAFTSGQATFVGKLLIQKDYASTDAAGKIARTQIFTIFGEVAFVVLLSLFASMGSEASSAAMMLIVALWIVWALHNTDKMASFFKAIGGAFNTPAK